MIYSDLNSFTPTQKPLLSDAEAVYQSLIHLFNTRPGEELFNPTYGIALDDYLFELMDTGASLAIFAEIKQAIQRWEPRVILNESLTQVIANPDENRFDLELYFAIQGVEGNNFSLVGTLTQG